MNKADLFNYGQPDQPVSVGGDSGVILRGLSATEWETFVGFCESQVFAPGECIMRAGDSGRAIFIIRAGRVRPELPGRKLKLPLMEPGTVFGELAFFDGGKRSATLWAVDRVELLTLPFDAFERLGAWHPHITTELLLDLGRVLSQRLRRAEARE
jgi:SulP family sulfate permease